MQTIPNDIDVYVQEQLRNEYHVRFSNSVRESEMGEMLKYLALIKRAVHLRVY